MFGKKALLFSVLLNTTTVMATENLGEKLLFAVLREDISEVRSLLKQGANINYQSKYGESPLYASATNCTKDIFDVLLENGADIYMKNHDGYTILIRAAYSSCEEIALPLIDQIQRQRSEEIDAFNKYGRTSLTEAVNVGNYQIAKRLIEAGADVQHKDNIGRTPLFFVKDKNMAELIIKSGGKVNAFAKSDKGEIFSPLLHVAEFGTPLTLKILLEHISTDGLNLQNEKGETPLIKAIKRNQIRKMIYLLDAGANPNIKDNEGLDAAKWAYYLRLEEIKRILNSYEQE